MVSTHDRIKDFSLNASFYTLAGSSRQAEEVFVESLLVEVCILMGGITGIQLSTGLALFSTTHPVYHTASDTKVGRNLGMITPQDET